MITKKNLTALPFFLIFLADAMECIYFPLADGYVGWSEQWHSVQHERRAWRVLSIFKRGRRKGRKG